jgi:hypothetical protein
VTVSIGDKSFTLADQGNGAYGLTSQDDAAFLYEDAARIELTVLSAGTTYTASVVAPGKEEIAQFAVVDPWPLQHSANADLGLTRSSTDDVAFTTVVEADRNTSFTDVGSIPSTYTDVPTTALDLLDLVANDSLWKRKVITLPGRAFPHPDTYYAVLVTTVKRGETSTNLFAASALLVGKAEVGVVKTRR